MTVSWNHIRRVEEDQHKQDMKDDYHISMSDEDLIAVLDDLQRTQPRVVMTAMPVVCVRQRNG